MPSIRLIAAAWFLFAAASSLARAESAGTGSQVAYLGGTLKQFAQGSDGIVDAGDQDYLVFWTRKSNLRVPYERINLLEYGQKVSRRVAMAVVISPMCD